MRSFGPDVRGASWVGSLFLTCLIGALAVGCGGQDDPSVGAGGSKGRRPPPTRGDGGTGGGGSGGSGGVGGAGGSGGSLPSGLRVSAVRPPRGPIDGGTSVLLEGAGFVLTVHGDAKPTDVTEVYFGENRAIGARVIDDDTILATTPPGGAGDVDIIVRNQSAEAICEGCFRYQAPVDLQGIEPAEGPIHGGIEITLRGEHLRDSMHVVFGKRAALDVELQADGSLRAILPPGDVAGSVDVRVYDQDGQDWMRKAFTYVAPLRIDEVDPPGGPAAGGNAIVLTGSGFTAGAEVFVGGTRAGSQLQQDGRLEVTIPAGSPGTATIEVRTQSGSAFAPYGYFDPADTEVRLYALTPATGSLAGGTRITLVGTNLDRGNLALRFGGAFADDATALSPHFIKATLPPGAAPGPVDVDVRVTGGQDVLEDGFTYVHAIDVESVVPGNGPIDGGTTITIAGSGFPPGARVFVGALEATQVEHLGDGALRAVTPRGSDGPVPVRVVHPGDETIAGILPGGFYYDGPFSVARIDPATGSQSGGTRVIVRGAGFGPGFGAVFDEAMVQSVEVLDPFTAIVFTPRGNQGTVDVHFDDGAGALSTLEAAYTYYDPSDSGGGSSGGPLNGTLNVTVLDDGNPPRRGLPLPNVLVVLGIESETALQGMTDDRGQITFSDPSLVKAQTVSAALDGYQSTTVVGQTSENLTILLQPNQELPPCANGIDDDGDGLIDEEDINGCFCGPHNYDELEDPPPAHLCMCANPLMPVETNTCCDGIDNDGDGLVDAEDPDCACTGGMSEGPLAQCSNCIDDDGDGRIDFNNPNFPPDPGCASPSDNEDGIIVAGRVWGFKLPGGRTLGPDEVEEAHVRITVPSYFHAPPLSGAQSPIIVSHDGGSYAYEFPAQRFMAIYALYGVRNLVTNDFEPLLLGVRRNVNATPGKDITDADIILDTHLTMEVPVAVENPPTVNGFAGTSTVFSYIDLGAEGWIPIGQSTTDQASTALVSGLPPLSGENFAFQVWGQNVFAPNSLSGSFRTQAGDVSQGVTIGPMMGLTRIVQPAGRFEGVIEWAVEPGGPPADVTLVSINEMTLAGQVLQWHIVVPGTENRVTVPPQVLERLRAKYPPGMQLLLTVLRGREPRFNFDQWSYDNLSLIHFSSFTNENALITL